MDFAPYATPTSDQQLSSECAMNATTARMRDDVSYVVGLESLMHTIARSARCKKRIEMDVPRLSTLARQRRTCSMTGRNMEGKAQTN